MRETPTPRKFGVEGETECEDVHGLERSPMVAETEVAAKAARRRFPAAKKLRVLRNIKPQCT